MPTLQQILHGVRRDPPILDTSRQSEESRRAERRRYEIEIARLGPRSARNNQFGYSMSKAKRWRSPQRPDAACMKNTKSEAIVFFKNLLGVEKLPDGFVIESF